MIDDEFLDQFKTEPEVALAEYDLSADEAEVLKAGKEDEIREILGSMPADGALDVGSKTSPSASSVTEGASGSALLLDD
jgi:hypothetical protein